MSSVDISRKCEGITNLKFSFIPDHDKQEAVVLIPDDKMTMISFKGNRVCCVLSSLLQLHDFTEIYIKNAVEEFKPLEYDLRCILNVLKEQGVGLKGYNGFPEVACRGLEVEVRLLEEIFSKDPFTICATMTCGTSGEGGEVVGGVSCAGCNSFRDVSGPGETISTNCCCGCDNGCT